MTNTAPPFVGFTDLGRLPEETRAEVLAKMLSGELSAYVYSSNADGKLDPVPIAPAQFSMHWTSAQTEANLDDEDRLDRNSWRMAKMEPFQIRLSDEDRRRDPSRLSRIKMGVPHWVYVARDQLAKTLNEHKPSEPDEQPAARPASEARIRTEVAAVYAEAAAQETKPPNIKELGKVVQQRLADVGLGAAQIQIQKIGDEAEFKKLRRPPGATVFSQRSK